MKPDWREVLPADDPRTRGLPLATAMRAIHSPVAMRLLRWIVPLNPHILKRDRPSTAFLVDLVRRMYAEHPERVVWASAFVPSRSRRSSWRWTRCSATIPSSPMCWVDRVLLPPRG